MRRWCSLFVKVLLFYFFSMVQVSYAFEVEKKPFVIPAEDPQECLSLLKNPCALSTGDRPRLIKMQEYQWEFDRYSVAEISKEGQWKLYKGMAVVMTQKALRIHTPFADIQLGRSKVMIHVLDDRVRVMSLMGEGITVIPRLTQEEEYLVPGFQNWFAGVGPEGQETGVVSVMDLGSYARDRSQFFLDERLGFVKELNLMAGIVKWAAHQAGLMYKDLYSRKIASLEEAHKEKVLKKRRKIQFNKHLRELFLRKVRYDY